MFWKGYLFTLNIVYFQNTFSSHFLNICRHFDLIVK
uniref:Uncharacterized protein n=1 Tax=Anguilla anguilla TaxID=7936 RepID=A0A0E9W3C6_ANGAN